MDVKKPAFKKPWVYIKLLCVCLTIIAILLCIVHSLCFANKYYVTASGLLIVEAQIVAIIEDHSGDVSSYDAIMQYVYEGDTFETVYKSFTSKSEAYALLNSKVTARLDPRQPSSTLESYGTSANSSMMASALFVFFLTWFLCFPHRKSYVSTYGWRMETVKKDMMLRNAYPVSVLLIWIVVFAIAVSLYPDVYLFLDRFSFVILLLPAIYVVAGIWGLARFLQGKRLIKQGRITLSHATCKRKKTQKDSDGDKQHYIEFTDGKHCWKRHVSPSIYEKMTEGTVVNIALLGNRKKPALHYSVLVDDVF